MKRVKLFILSFLFAILLSMYIMPVYAEQNGFEFEPFPEEDKEYFLSNINVTLIDTLYPKGIECFDVNENGLIALGYTRIGTDKQIGIYSSDGEFVRGYRFDSMGSFDVGFDGDFVVIYFVRGSVAVTVDANGEIVNVCDIADTLENDKYWRYISSPIRIVGDKRYYLKNDMGILNLVATSYSQLVVVDKNGQSTILYDVNSQQFEKTLFYLCVFIAFFAVVIGLVIRTFIKTHKSWENGLNSNSLK